MNKENEGREALIHLNVPRATKARWVRRSRAEGKKLTDWITERVEAANMNVYKIPDSIEKQYRGAGWALAAILNGQPVALRYLADVAPEIEAALTEGGAMARKAAGLWINTEAAGPVVRELQALGEVSIGMCSAWEFVEQ